MKSVDTIARVRREYFVRGRPIREIARELHVSRNTVRKILRSGETAFEYERSVRPQPKLGQWREDLERLLAVNAARERRERVTLLRIFEDLRGLKAAPDGDRQMVEILGAVLSDGLSAVEAACAEALGEGVHSADVILNILARRRDHGPPVTIMTPEALRLRQEPAADCARYDSLRRAI